MIHLSGLLVLVCSLIVFGGLYRDCDRRPASKHGVAHGHNQTQTDNLLSDDDDNKLSVWVTNLLRKTTNQTFVVQRTRTAHAGRSPALAETCNCDRLADLPACRLSDFHFNSSPPAGFSDIIIGGQVVALFEDIYRIFRIRTEKRR